jgi:P27 family predicted phage terminase small subunit
LKVLEGNRGHRPLDITSTFRPMVGLPSIPKGLPREAVKVWKRLSPELLQYNLLSVVYSDAFEDLCRTVARVGVLNRALDAREDLLRSQGKDPAEAYEVRTPNGMAMQHPTYHTLKAERAHMHVCIDSFGLDPSSCAKVTSAVRGQLSLFSDNTPAAIPAPPAGGRGEPAAPGPQPQARPQGFDSFPP